MAGQFRGLSCAPSPHPARVGVGAEGRVYSGTQLAPLCCLGSFYKARAPKAGLCGRESSFCPPCPHLPTFSGSLKG